MATPTSLPATFVAGNVLTAAQMNDLRGAFRILQVVSTTKTDTFSMSSSTMADITGLSVSITPTSNTSKIFVFADIAFDASALSSNLFQLMRDSTPIGVGAAAGSRRQVSKNYVIMAADRQMTTSMSVLDSPASTSSLAYKVQCCSEATLYVNRRATDSDSTSVPNARSASTITVMEVSA